MDYTNGEKQKQAIVEELASLLWTYGYNFDEQSEAVIIYQFLAGLINCDDYDGYITDNIDEFNEIMSIISVHNVYGNMAKQFEKHISVYQEKSDEITENIYEETITIFSEILEHLQTGYGKLNIAEDEIELLEILGLLVVEKGKTETREQIERIIDEEKIKRKEEKRNQYEAVLRYIQSQQFPVTKKDIYKNVPRVTPAIVSQVLANEKKILSYYGEYIWADNVFISKEDLNYLNVILKQTISYTKVHHMQEIYDVIRVDNKSVLDRNMLITPNRLFSICRYYFEYEYKFERPYIASRWTKIKTTTERIQDYISGKKEVEIRKILDYAKQNHMFVPNIMDTINELNGSHLMSSKYGLIMIDGEHISRSNALIVEKIIMQEIIDDGAKGIPALCCANQLPDIGIKWDEWLIYSILRKWGSRVKTCTTSGRYAEAVPVVYIGKQPSDEQLEDIAIDCKNRHLQMADNMENIDELLEDMFDDIEF